MTSAWPVARGRVPEREAFAFAATVLFVVFAGDGIPNLVHWVGWAVICAAAATWGITILVRARPSLRRPPPALALFLAWCLVTVVWSHWRVPTIASFLPQVLSTVMAFVIATTLSWRRIVDAVSLALRWVLWGSLLLELVVAVIVRHPVVPVWTHYTGHVPDAFFFSRAELLTGGRIQGLPGNANLLAMVALLAAVVVAVQWAEGRMRRVRAIGWLTVATVVFCLTRSSTVIVAAVVTALVLLAALAIRRIPTERRTPRYLLGLAVAVALVAVAVVAERPILALLGKGSDLTGRSDIWAAVWGMVQQHPVLGWGWIGYWWPNQEPLNHLAIRNGVVYLQAHNAYLDIWMQVGIVGLVLFVLYLGATTVRAWWNATAFSYGPDQRPLPFTPVSLAPILIVTALLVQAFAESRLLYESYWILVAILAIKTRIVLVGEEPASTADGARTPPARREYRQAAR